MGMPVMNGKNKDTNWVEIIDKFSGHKERIVDFCKENNITPQ
ncbi:hypothetical protein CLFE_016920 [Clostridium felsineum DSM 794]|nr:hypothetical protein CLFE_016920 [Clostridium felsineum DSM 794]